jgi:hypothetical protein
MDRLGGSDWAKRERVKMLAWQKPKSNRRVLINALLQFNCNFVFCFRAKQSVKPMKIEGKTEMVPQGFMPIAGDEFVFEMTVNLLLLPAARGVPTWQTENVGERMMIKPARQFEAIFADRRPMDETIGRALADWARGGLGSQPAPPASPLVASHGAPPATPPVPAGGVPTESEELEKWDAWLQQAADSGTEALAAVWKRTPKPAQKVLKSALDRRFKPRALQVDQEKSNAKQLSDADPGAGGAGDSAVSSDAGGTGAEKEKPAVASEAAAGDKLL